MARPERFELPTLWFEDKSTIRRKILRLNVWSDNKEFSSRTRMCAAVCRYVRLIVGSLQKSLQCIGPIFGRLVPSVTSASLPPYTVLSLPVRLTVSYSVCRARIGSSVAARRAGTNAARNAARTNAAAVTSRIRGS